MMILTTTATLDGWEVVDYLGPVSAQFVIGTGVFTDFFSSFTDFFGAHSQSYQKKLDRIDQEALSMIRLKARHLGATAVLGLRVDHDEISGSGKSMLMVTASGTAVRARRVRDQSENEASGRVGLLSAADLTTMVDRQSLMERAASGDLEWFTNEHWQFVIENRVVEIAPALLRHLEWAFANKSEEGRTRTIAMAREFFAKLEPDQASGYLQGCIASSEPMWDLAVEVMDAGQMLELEWAQSCLMSEDVRTRARALRVATLHLPAYSNEDIPKLESLLHVVRTSFSPAEVAKRKGLFGEKEVWQCAQGHEVAGSVPRCPECQRDRFGLRYTDETPKAVIGILERRINALREALSMGRTS